MEVYFMKTKKFCSNNTRITYAPYFQCRDFGIQCLNLRGCDLAVYVLLSNYALYNYINRQQKYNCDEILRKYVFASCSLKYITFKTGYSLASVKRTIKKLRDLQIIARVNSLGSFKSVNGRNIYIICKFVSLDMVGYEWLADTFANTYNATAYLMANNEPLDKKVNVKSNKELNDNEKETKLNNNKLFITRDNVACSEYVSRYNKMYQYLIAPESENISYKSECLSRDISEIISIAKAKWIEEE